MNARNLLLVAALCGLSGLGCATSRIDNPPGFAVHGRSGEYDFRASDGEGVVLAVRSEANRPRGDLAFWTSSLDSRLRLAGYEARERQPIVSADGLPGQQLRYAVQDAGREIAFWVTVFVTPRRVVIVEAGGDTAFFGPKVELVQSAIASVHAG
jgi:hypothetical protein